MHLLDMSNNRANMAYVGETPWHGLGQQLPENTDIDQWRVAAGLDWHIEKRAVFHGVKDEHGNKKASVIDGRKALVRSDTQACLSIMSDRYQIVQPADILEFYRDLVDGSRFTIETAGSLKGGAKIWALARGNLDLRIKGTDLIKPYLLLATACDGTMSTVADFTTVRVVCNNTLTMAVGTNGAKAGIRVRHTTAFNADDVKDQLGLVDDAFDTFGHDVDQLAERRVSDDEAVQFFFDRYAKIDDRGNVENEKGAKRIVRELMRAYRSSPGATLASAQGTAWGLVNAVTHFEDYRARARSTENRFNSGQFGPGANRKAEAFDAALALVA
jgi:phage/plasmid-like protein (TIGR03299 family)